MFDDLVEAGDPALITAMDAAARTEAAAAARRLASIAELVVRHAIGPTDSAHWSCDNWDFIASQVAAALAISQSLASHQMYLALALRNRLPGIAGLFAQGQLSLRLVTTIIWRTDNIKNPAVLRVVDAALANDATRYGPLSQAKTQLAIDEIVERWDPAAVRRSHAKADDRQVVIDSADHDSGTATIYGSLLSADAILLDRRLQEMAHQVCPDDPRTVAQRRADALGTLAVDGKRLVCQCPNMDCPARTDTDPRAAAVVIHIVTEPASLVVTPDTDISNQAARPSGQIIGGPRIPAIQLAALAATGSRIAPLNDYADAASAPRYRPPAAMERFIRCRDMTCRFPGCDRPADQTDIDHTIAYPYGPTHPANLKCLCRKHHLLKTFWGGPKGWRDKQLPDGTIIWTSPTGHTYTTRPGSRLLFPTLSLPTQPLPSTPAVPPHSAARTLMMPTRARTRAQDRARRIDRERANNCRARTARPTQPATASAPVPATDDDPPPF